MRELPKAIRLTSRVNTSVNSLTRHSGVFYSLNATPSRSYVTETIEKSPVHKEEPIKDHKDQAGDDKNKKNSSGEEEKNKKQKDPWDRIYSVGQWAMATAVLYGGKRAADQFSMNKTSEINMANVKRGVKIIYELDAVSKGLNELRQELYEINFSSTKEAFKEKEFIALRGKIDELTSAACRIILYHHSTAFEKEFKEVIAKDIYPTFLKAIIAIWDFENKKEFSPQDTVLSCFTNNTINYDSSLKEKSDYLIHIMKTTHTLLQICRKILDDSLHSIEIDITNKSSAATKKIQDLPSEAVAVNQTGQYMKVEDYIQNRIKELSIRTPTVRR